jgi:hypothetical protein
MAHHRGMKLNHTRNKGSLFLVIGLAVGSALALPQASQAAVRINTLGVFEYGLPSSGTSFMSAGGGASFDFGFGASPVSLDLGVYYHNTAFNLAASNALEIPGFFRFHFARRMLNFGVGFFANYNLTSSSAGWGPIASLQFRIPAGNVFGFILEARYGVDLSALSGSSIYLHKIQGLAGFSFELGGKK